MKRPGVRRNLQVKVAGDPTPDGSQQTPLSSILTPTKFGMLKTPQNGIAGGRSLTKKFNKFVVKQKTIRVVSKPQVSLMAMAMRFFFIKSLKKFLNDYNGTRLNTSDDAWDTDTYNTLRTYSKLFSGQFADAYLNCHLMVVDGYNYVQEQNALFPNGSEAFQAFLQNLVGQVVTLNNIAQRLSVAVDNND